MATLLLLASVPFACGSSSRPAAPGVSFESRVSSGEPKAFQQPSIARDPKDASHLALAYMDGDRRDICYLGTSRDGGRTWSVTRLAGAGAKFPLPDQFTACRDAVTTFGGDGTLYYAYQTAATFYSRAALVVSRDGGATFDAPTLMDPSAAPYTGQRGGGDWWPQVATDGASRVYVAWNGYRPMGQPPFTIMVAASTDHGRTFSPPVMVTPSTLPSGDLPMAHGGALAVGADGTVYASWLEMGAWNRVCGFADTPQACDTPAVLYVAASHDHGSTFDQPVAVDSRFNVGCPGNIPGAGPGRLCDELHYDNNVPHLLPVVGGTTAGTAFVAWFDGDPQAPARVRLSQTGDSGRTWSAAHVVGVPPGRTADSQFLPQLSLSSSGRLDIAYYDRDSSGNQNTYLVFSSDGASRFSTPLKVSSTTSSAKVGPPGSSGGVNFGNQLGLTSSGDGAVVAWTDSRNGNTDNAKQDIYVAAVRIPA